VFLYGKKVYIFWNLVSGNGPVRHQVHGEQLPVACFKMIAFIQHLKPYVFKLKLKHFRSTRIPLELNLIAHRFSA